jgi:hypothetical protein
VHNATISRAARKTQSRKSNALEDTTDDNVVPQS